MREEEWGGVAENHSQQPFTLGKNIHKQNSRSQTYVNGFVDVEAKRCGAKREQLERVQGPLPECQGQHLALTVLNVPSSLDSGWRHTAILKNVSGAVD